MKMQHLQTKQFIEYSQVWTEVHDLREQIQYDVQSEPEREIPQFWKEVHELQTQVVDWRAQVVDLRAEVDALKATLKSEQARRVEKERQVDSLARSGVEQWTKQQNEIWAMRLEVQNLQLHLQRVSGLGPPPGLAML